MKAEELVSLLRQAAPSPSLTAWVLALALIDRVRGAPSPQRAALAQIEVEAVVSRIRAGEIVPPDALYEVLARAAQDGVLRAAARSAQKAIER